MNGDLGKVSNGSSALLETVPEAAIMQLWTSGPPTEAAPSRSPSERLLDTLEVHAAAEADSLDDYARLAEQARDPVVALLMRLVLEDETRHHHLLSRMAASVRDALNWTHSPAALPIAPLAPEPAAAELLAATRARIREEQEGIRHFRELARQQAHTADGLFSLLLETMAMDSQKHERILTFILRHLEAK